MPRSNDRTCKRSKPATEIVAYRPANTNDITHGSARSQVERTGVTVPVPSSSSDTLLSGSGSLLIDQGALILRPYGNRRDDRRPAHKLALRHTWSVSYTHLTLPT